jgi:hypothetical protein
MLRLIPTLAIIYPTQSVARNPLQGHEKLCMESIQIIDTHPADPQQVRAYKVHPNYLLAKL